MRCYWVSKSQVIQRTWCACLAVLLLVSAGPASCRPVALRSIGGVSRSDASFAMDFLSKYGYLQSSDLGAGSLRTEDQLRNAIRTMQRFGNVPQTGVLDRETIQLMRMRRCGVPDLIGSAERVRRYALQGQKWTNTNLTWSIKEDPAGRTQREMVRSQMSRAFKVWSDASVLSFSEVGTTADIVISFLHGSHGDGYPFDGEGAVLAHAFFPGEGIGGDAHFDAEEKWISQQPTSEEEGVNLFAVAAHEIGHSLGLSHSSTPGSLMFPYYQIVDGHFELPDDDANGIQQLYGSREEKKWAPLPTAYTVSTPSTTKPSTKTTAAPTTTTRKRYKTTTSMTRSFERSSTTRSTTTTIVPSLTMGASTPDLIVTTTTEPNPDLGEPPDGCNTSIDAISVIRGEVFLFKGKFFWRLNRSKVLKRGYPAPTYRFWHELPPDIARIDALYERPTDTKIVFFSGRRYWLFAANEMVPGYPRPLTDLGLPPRVDRIDAAMVWGHNGKTYLFSGRQYWKLDESDGKVELDYPRDISAWRGVPAEIDAAFQWTDGNTYFFKGRKFWQFNDVKMKTRPVPRDVNEFWFGCRLHREEETTITSSSTNTSLIYESVETSGSDNSPVCFVMVLLCILRCLLSLE